MKSWSITNDQLDLVDNGTHISVTADEVFRAVLENDSPWPDLAPGKHDALTGIEFSPYPVSLELVVVDAEISGLPTLELQVATQRGERFPISTEAMMRGHVISGNTWYPLAPDSIDEIRTLLERVDADGGHLKNLRGLLDLKAAASAGAPVVDRTKSGRDQAVRLAAAETGGPEGILAKLYPYQKDGWRWLRFIVREQLGGLLADEMGLGKTLQVISVLRDPGSGKWISRALVVAPGSLLENWVREFKKFAPDLSVLKLHGTERTGRPAELEKHDVVITSYDTAVSYLGTLCMVDWSVVILDEAQNIKNPDAIRTKSVKKIPRRVGLAMTGTPVENRLTDLWSIMDFVVPGYLGDLGTFRATFPDDTDGAAQLEPLVTPLMLRRRVPDVADDLPERIDIPEAIDMSDDEAAEYERVRQEILNSHGAAGNLVALTSLRMFCAHPGLMKGSYGIAATTNAPFTKFERLKELLVEIFETGEKALVFTSYTEMADIIARYAAGELGVFSATLDGRLPIDDRQPLIDRFSAVDGPAVLVLNPIAGGAGLNITAANHVIHYNLEWNPAREDQASARAHRRGQTRPVTVRRLFYAGTVEEVVDDRVQRKRSMSDAAIVGVEGSAGDLRDVVAALERSPVRKG